MKKSQLPGFIAIFIGFLICLGGIIFIAIRTPTKGIVVLEGYEHGVAFCGNEFPVVGWLTSEGEAFFDKANNITFVVNKGHLADPQVKELRLLAKKECSKLVQM